MELSLCMIVRNEEARLGACLESVRDAVDEMIIVDTGSTDKTKELARLYTPSVFDFEWTNDFSAARNASLARATKPFILWLDADDVLDPPELHKLIALKARLHERVDAVMLPYHYAFAPDGAPSLVFERERIVRREAGFFFSGAVHEAMAVSGNVLHEDVVIRHTGRHGESSNARNLAIYEAQLAKGSALTPRDWYYYARELKSAGRTQEALDAFDAFLLMDGWVENRIDACMQRGECLGALGQTQAAREAYLSSLRFDAPRAEALCALGAGFLEEGKLEAAAHWYGCALLCRRRENTGAFISPDAYGYVPLMQLCMIFSRMGEDNLASQMNEQALLLKPGDEAALANRAYFKKRLGGEEIDG